MNVEEADSVTVAGGGELTTLGLVVWLLLVVLSVGYGIGGYGLIHPDEGRNAEVAREMSVTNDYVLPHLNGLPYLDKPVLYFAAVAASIEIFGANEFAARVVSLLFGLATAALTGFFALRLWGRNEATVAATATATAPLALAMSRVVIMDAMLSFLVVSAIVCFYVAIERRRAGSPEASVRRPWLAWTVIAWAAIGLGVLTKGPVALAVPLLVAAPYAVRRRASFVVWHPLGPVVMLAIGLPWVCAVSREIPNFLHYVVVTETWTRMTTDELHRTEPFWFFVPILLLGAFPWSVMVLSNLRLKEKAETKADRDTRFFLWLWLLVPLVFFSLSRGKQEQYVLPLVPAVALLVASRWSPRPKGIRVAAAAWGLLGLAMLTAAALGMPGLDTARVSTGLAVRTALGFGATAVAGAIVAWPSSYSRRHLTVIGLALPVMAFPMISASLMESVARDRSVRWLASDIEGRLTPETRLLWVEAYAPGLSFYLERIVPVASIDGHEFRSNYILRNVDDFFDEDGPLRPLASAERAISECTGPQILLFGAEHRDLVDAIGAAGMPLLAENRRWTVFGPDCASAEPAAN